ncbi:MAG: methyltransferase domain-containing protein [Phyllobacteriaceae bacterium]|nr:methyltransferase domain-containing protein [Phyllobacteriaceae bacterium]
MTMPRLFDRALLAARRDRARAHPRPGADFLLARAVDDLEDRLATVLRRFETAVDLGPFAGAAGPALRASGKIDRIVAAGPDAGAVDMVADEEALPFGPESLDLVVSLLGLHLVDDLPGALVQIRRALVGDGLFLAALLGGQTLNELRDSLTAAEVELTGGVSPRVIPFLDVRDLGGLLQRAGFALPVTDIDRVTVRYGSMFDLLADLRAMGATNPLVERSRKPTSRRLFLRAAEIYAERPADPDGRLRATFEIVWASGWTPHVSQQQPLRPGSATHRLADALHTREIPLADRGGEEPES